MEKKLTLSSLATFILALLVVVFAADFAAAEEPSLKTVSSVVEAATARREWVPFELEVKAMSPLFYRGGGAFLAEDPSGRVIIHAVPQCDTAQIRPGAVMKVAGKTSRCDLKNQKSAVLPFATAVSAVRFDTPAPPVEAKIRDIVAGRYNLEYVTVSGEVKDAFNDDIDPHFSFLVLVQEGASIYVPIRRPEKAQAGLARLIGAEVSVAGIVHGNDGTGARRYADVTMFCGGFDSVRVLREANGMDGVPQLEDARSLNPAAISTMERRRATGRVVAVWGGGRFLMKTAEGELMRIELADGEPPRCGEMVEAAGFPETDLFNVNFGSALWRPAPTAVAPPPDDPPEEVSASDIVTNAVGMKVVNSALFGKAVTLEGVVLRVAPDGGGRVMLESCGYAVPVDCSTCPKAFADVGAGYRVTVSGVVVFDADNWHANDIFPRINEVAIAIKGPDDVHVVSRPSWWTAGRLLFVIGILAVAIAVVLFRAHMAKAASKLRLDERTRLAAELHDYISQDMTAISYQVTAARRTREDDPAECSARLDTAERMLGSCRTELRRCLWDLRNEALDERDMAKAVKASIAPISCGARTSVEMDIPRSRLDDSTMHTLLSVVRELVSNAVKHGRAATVSVRGEIAGDTLSLTVSDDGAGFDAAKAPGMGEGHFGLAGVRERAARHGGMVSIDSAPGRGTCVKVTMSI